jgi:hypothetical protein
MLRSGSGVTVLPSLLIVQQGLMKRGPVWTVLLQIVLFTAAQTNIEKFQMDSGAALCRTVIPLCTPRHIMSGKLRKGKKGARTLWMPTGVQKTVGTAEQMAIGGGEMRRGLSVAPVSMTAGSQRRTLLVTVHRGMIPGSMIEEQRKGCMRAMEETREQSSKEMGITLSTGTTVKQKTRKYEKSAIARMQMHCTGGEGQIVTGDSHAPAANFVLVSSWSGSLLLWLIASLGRLQMDCGMLFQSLLRYSARCSFSASGE